MADVYLTVTGAGGKTGVDWANAYDQTQIQNAFDDLVAGETLYIEEGTYTTPSIIDTNSTSGTATNPIYVIGVDSLHVEDGTRPVFDVNAAYNYGIEMNSSYWVFKNLEVIDAVQDGFHRTSGNSYTFFNCESSNNAREGFFLVGAAYTNIVSCVANNNARAGFNFGGADYMSLDRAIMIGNVDGARSLNGGASNCIIHNNSTYGFNVAGGQITNCVIDGNGIGIYSPPAVVTNCRITHNTTAINASGFHCTERGNHYYNNGTKFTHGTGIIISLGDSIDGTGDGYTDRTNDDFTITDGNEGTGVSLPIGLLDEADNVGYSDFGIPPQSAGAGGRQTRFQIRGA